MNRISFKISFKFMVLLVCYVPILSVFLPKTNFGAGIPDLDVTRVLSYLMVFVFTLEIVKYRYFKLNFWIFVVLSFVFIKCASPCWSRWYSYNVHVLQVLFDNTIVPFIISVVAVNIFQNEEVVKKFIKHVTISASILSIVAVCQFIFVPEANIDFRSVATMNNPNLLAIYLVACLPCLLFSIEEQIISKKIGLMFQLFFIVGVVSTISRKGIITMIICYFIYFTLLKRFKVIMIYFMIFVLLGVAFSFNKNITTRFASKKLESNIQGKWNMTIAGFRMFQEKPILGNGYEGYYKRFGEFFPKAWSRNYDAHNEYITVLANFGLMGFIFFLGIFCYPLYFARKKMKRFTQGVLRSNFQRNMSILCIATIFPLMINISYAGKIWSQSNLLFLFYSIVALVFCESDGTIDHDQSISC